MARAVLCIRPEPGLSETITMGKACGLPMIGAPLFEIEPVRWTAPEGQEFDALLIGSANVFRHGGAQLASFRGLPVFAVGQTTAEMAKSHGFTIGKVGRGGLQNVLDTNAAKPMRYLRLCGADHVALDVPSWQSIQHRVVYRSKKRQLSPNTAKLLETGPIVALHSVIAAEHFSQECNRLGIDRAAVALAALGPRISAAAGTGWADVATATAPNDTALLALIENMCQ